MTSAKRAVKEANLRHRIANLHSTIDDLTAEKEQLSYSLSLMQEAFNRAVDRAEEAENERDLLSEILKKRNDNQNSESSIL